MAKRGGARPGTANIGGMDRAAYGSRKQAVRDFREALKDGGWRPSTLLLALMRGDEIEHTDAAGVMAKVRASFAERIELAKSLVQYELPRLASIEADVTTTEKSHEDWVRELNGEAPRKEGETLQ